MRVRKIASGLTAVTGFYLTVGLVASTILITRPIRTPAEQLPNNNQTLYELSPGTIRSLQLNVTIFTAKTVYINICPCTRDVHWVLLLAKTPTAEDPEDSLLEQKSGNEMTFLTLDVFLKDKYVLQLSSRTGGSVAVNVAGEPPRMVRLRLRVRSKRRMAVAWDPSPVDPQETIYYVVASRNKNYKALCAALKDDKSEDQRHKWSHVIPTNYLNKSEFSEFDNNIEADMDTMSPSFRLYKGRKMYQRPVFDNDPIVLYVGSKTNALLKNLDRGNLYYVSVFGITKHHSSGILLANGSARTKATNAIPLTEESSFKNEIRGKTVFIFKGKNNQTGIWIALSCCGGSVEVAVSVAGNLHYTAKNIDNHYKFFVASPGPDRDKKVGESSLNSTKGVDFGANHTKYTIKVTPSSRNRAGSVSIELLASSEKWIGISAPELLEDTVRELRPKRSCKSVEIAFLPAITNNKSKAIRYCVRAHDMRSEHSDICSRKSAVKLKCVHHRRSWESSAIMQRVTGLQPGTKYGIYVTAATHGTAVPYRPLYVETHPEC